MSRTHWKGRPNMSRSGSAPCHTEEDVRLAKYRAKSAAMVHKAIGDPEEVCKDGLSVFQALSPARKRANKTAPQDE